MICGGSKIKRPDNGDKLLSEMRDYVGMELNIKLGDYKIEFRPDVGEWKSKIRFNDYQLISTKNRLWKT